MKPLVGIIMGSQSDWETLKVAEEILVELGVPHEVKVVSAHRTPDLLFEYAGSAEQRGLSAIIAGAGGAAHLPGMAAAKTRVPVLGVPCSRKPSTAWTPCCPSCRCPKGCRWPPLRSGRQVPPTPRCSLSHCCPDGCGGPVHSPASGRRRPPRYLRADPARLHTIGSSARGSWAACSRSRYPLGRISCFSTASRAPPRIRLLLAVRDFSIRHCSMRSRRVARW